MRKTQVLRDVLASRMATSVAAVLQQLDNSGNYLNNKLYGLQLCDNSF